MTPLTSHDVRGVLLDAPIACHEIDVRGTVTFVNPAECALMGLDEGQILGRPVWEFVAPEEREASREAVRHKLAGLQPLQAFERGYSRRDGERLELEIHETLLRDDRGRVSGIRSFMLDATQRKRAEDSLRASEARFRHLVENASDIIYRTDLAGRFTLFNPTSVRLLGYTAEELTGMRYIDLIHPDQKAVVQRFYRRQLTERIARTYHEVLVRKKDGGSIWFGQTVVLVEEGGHVAGFEAITRDITAQRRAEEEQKRAREELEARVRGRTQELELAIEFLRREMEERQQAEQERQRLEAQIQHRQRLESLGVLAGGIAHDFNNLLASILGYASLATSEVPEGATVRRHLDQVVEAARNASELTQQMLAYSGRGQFVLEYVDLSRLIEETTRLVGSLISKKAALRMDLAAGLPPVHADVAQLRQIVMNLVTNASDALGEHGGVIRISTSVRPVEAGTVARVEPGATLAPGDYVCLDVEDTGCGMDQATGARIFDPFFTTKFTGRGLGLAAVQGIVRGHRGAIAVESQPGQGTRFRVLLPASPAEAQAGSVRPIDEIVAKRGQGTVLVVDDEGAVRELAALILERAGYTVVEAVDGEDAVMRFREQLSDIRALVLDLTMPGMDGSEVYQILHRLRPDLRVVICSGYNLQDFSDRFGADGRAQFLRKPYLPSELTARLQQALDAPPACADSSPSTV